MKRRPLSYTLKLALASLGVVFGDIGTSPLYAVRESLSPRYGVGHGPEAVLGVLSLIFWSLIIVISVKYLLFVMRADNHGEGGIMALTALVMPREENGAGAGRDWRFLAMVIGIFGAALLYGDGMITPAISVLSAVEGLRVASPGLSPYVLPITVLILIGLFSLQPRGTGGVGRLFGPVMLFWFFTLAVMGLAQIGKNPGVFAALWPGHALGFLLSHGVVGFLVLGSVFLVVTGGEALYADLGHFGRAPIRIAWFFYVLPALLLNYFGQGALILRDPAAVENPFFLMAPGWAAYPLVFLAATATVIASQAVISGSFSLTRQAIQLGFLPRMRVVQTSSEERGQVYVPFVNWTLMVFTLALVFGFKSSSNLAGAYGVGVSTDMVFTTLLFSLIAYQLWKWPGYKVLPMFLGFIVVDLAFWGANIVKVPQGGWVPLVVASVVYLLMSTWKFGREILHRTMQKLSLSLEDLVERLKDRAYPRIAGTGVYLSPDPRRAPGVLLAQLEHYGVVHERVVILTVRTSERPRVEPEKRVFLQPLGEGVERLIVSYGFMETPNLTRDLNTYTGLDLLPAEVSFFLGRELVVPTGRYMPRWREVLFGLMRRKAESPVIYFHLPPERALEIGVFAWI